jgi:hypothetical protein
MRGRDTRTIAVTAYLLDNCGDSLPIAVVLTSSSRGVGEGSKTANMGKPIPVLDPQSMMHRSNFVKALTRPSKLPWRSVPRSARLKRCAFGDMSSGSLR